MLRCLTSPSLALRVHVILALCTHEYSLSPRLLPAAVAIEQLRRVDLLKIDVEGAELDVLRGIEAAHWPLIRQVTMEVHDVGERIASATQLLRGAGFAQVRVEDPGWGQLLDNRHIYATRAAPLPSA